MPKNAQKQPIHFVHFTELTQEIDKEKLFLMIFHHLEKLYFRWIVQIRSTISIYIFERASLRFYQSFFALPRYKRAPAAAGIKTKSVTFLQDDDLAGYAEYEQQQREQAGDFSMEMDYPSYQWLKKNKL